ncbi:MAG: hypothetical protein F4Y82_00295 [Cenarchaeum sp. SB0665_bin_23]|nr:hypothetical protein [Cenarchaeum sp. SB0664_bin_35]MXY60547.1 hypothetical protein [Cenarchaeum sp. SB0665_bin_23]MXZ94166.1 hypothetical protein [Cenarchaeum sp. SB0666_bin_15]MYG32933.1 hypothetical protein [Cenarchaeum sp. SB0677_bin_16]
MCTTVWCTRRTTTLCSAVRMTTYYRGTVVSRLYPNESCNLGSINLAMYVDGGDLDWEYLAEDIRVCTRMLDGVVDMTRHPTIQIEKASNETRRIGLGVWVLQTC